MPDRCLTEAKSIHASKRMCVFHDAQPMARVLYLGSASDVNGTIHAIRAATFRGILGVFESKKHCIATVRWIATTLVYVKLRIDTIGRRSRMVANRIVSRRILSTACRIAGYD